MQASMLRPSAFPALCEGLLASLPTLCIDKRILRPLEPLPDFEPDFGLRRDLDLERDLRRFLPLRLLLCRLLAVRCHISHVVGATAE